MIAIKYIIAIILVICIVAAYLMMGRIGVGSNVAYTYKTIAPALCADVATNLVATGTVTAINGDNATIKWNSIKNPTPASRCTGATEWVRIADAQWNAQWLGDAGVNPTVNVDLKSIVALSALKAV